MNDVLFHDEINFPFALLEQYIMISSQGKLAPTGLNEKDQVTQCYCKMRQQKCWSQAAEWHASHHRQSQPEANRMNANGWC